MFNPSVNDVRTFFFDTYTKGEQNQILSALEKIAYSVILEHPEYRSVLSNPDKYMQMNWLPESGETNPFLHMSMHISILEQLSINQPFGVKDLYQKLVAKLNDEHEAQHQVMDCLAEMIWQSQYSVMQPDPAIYLSCLKNKI
ncbi:MAG: DUF1841 family protein [Neisseriaceae bacterium]|nr:MAG: DUF1841 family protein [Neisseriaceae bacterium]